MIVYNKKNKEINIPDGLGVNITINNIVDCPEPEDITITENGVYEGLYDRVEVNVEQGSGEEVKLQTEKIVRPSSTDDLLFNKTILIRPDEGYNGMRQAVAELGDVLEQVYNEGYDDGVTNGGGEGGSCDLVNEVIVRNGTYQPYLKYINLDGDDCFHTQRYYNPYRRFEIVFRPYGEGTIIGFYNWNPEDYWGIRMINDRQFYVRWGSRYGTFDVVPGEWNKVILEPENNSININGFGFTLEQDDNQDYPSNEITIGGEYQGTYTTANYDFQYVIIYDDVNENSSYCAYVAESENSITSAEYFGSGTATFYAEPKDGFGSITAMVQPNLEDKWEYWDNPDERERYISASEGFDGLGQVYVSIDAALNAENQRGKVQGENEIKSAITTLNVEKNGTYRTNSFNVMDIDNDDAFEMGVGRSEDSYYEIKFKINRNGSRIEGALLTIYDCDTNWNGIFLDSDSQISFKWYDKYGTASIDPNGWNIIRFSPNNPDTSKRVWVNGRSVEVNEGGENNYMEDCNYSTMCIGGRNTWGLTTGAFDLAYVHYFMNYQYGWEEGHTPFYYLPEANNQISRCNYFGDGVAWLERDGEVGYNEVNVNVKTYPTFLEDAINRVINKASEGMAYLDSQLVGKSSSGMMYIGAGMSNPVMTLKNFYIDRDLRENTDTLTTFICGTISSPSNNLIKPFVYTEGNSLGSIKVIAPYWYGGFDCTNVDIIENIFEGAKELEYMEKLYNLGNSFTTSRMLDLSNTNLSDEAQKKIALSIYDFTTPNQNGISNGYVKFNSNVTAETKDLYTAKNWLLWA